MPINVQLEVYEGPLDLLLHLIKKNEVGISDISISTITEQYLATLEMMNSLNLDVAGEFLVMAATLIHIKSRMLLPLEEGDEDEEEEGDPRDELVRRLLEYQRYKEAALELEGREVLYRDVFVRSSESRQKMAAGEIERVSLFDLLSAFRRVLERFPEEGVHIVKVEEISVQEKMNLLLDCLRRSTRVVFQTLFEGVSSRMDIVVTFLALLELIKIRAIRATQEERVGPIMIELTAPLGEEEGNLAKRETEEEEEYGA
ncbi:MAG: segregation/condensation protein A [Deltaproteobacteria bacterium]|nr:segregation/condensation protein A [Deltaproteobacteria bacterium]